MKRADVALVKLFRHAGRNLTMLDLAETLKSSLDLNKGASLSDGAVDGEMRIHSAHFVQVALKNIFQ